MVHAEFESKLLGEDITETPSQSLGVLKLVVVIVFIDSDFDFTPRRPVTKSFVSMRAEDKVVETRRCDGIASTHNAAALKQLSTFSTSSSTSRFVGALTP